MRNELVAEVEIGQSLGPYKVVRHIGGGATGAVYEVECAGKRCHRALKMFNPKDRKDEDLRLDSFLFEAKVLNALGKNKAARDARIVKVHGIGPSYYVMDLVTAADGTVTSLHDIQQRASSIDGEFSEKALAGWFVDVAQSLVFLHRQGLKHGDITPSNIVLDKHGHAVLVDFGTVQRADKKLLAAAELSGLFAEMPILRFVRAGTPGFTAPENHNCGYPSHSIAADSYSLAATFWYLLFNEPIAVDKYAGELILDDYHKELFVDERWARVLPLMLEHDSSKRITVEEALRAFTGGQVAMCRYLPGKSILKDVDKAGFDSAYGDLLKNMDDYANALSNLRWEDNGSVYEKEFVLDEIYRRYRTSELRLMKQFYEGRNATDVTVAQRRLRELDSSFMDDFKSAGLSKLADMIFYKLNALWAVANQEGHITDAAATYVESRVAVARAYLSVEAQFVFGKYRHLQWDLDSDFYFKEGRHSQKYRGERTADRLFVYERTITRYRPQSDVIAMQLESIAQRNRIEELSQTDTLDLETIWGTSV